MFSQWRKNTKIGYLKYTQQSYTKVWGPARDSQNLKITSWNGVDER